MVRFKQNASQVSSRNSLKLRSWGCCLGLAIAMVIPEIWGETQAIAQLPPQNSSSQARPTTTANILYVNPRLGDDRQGNGSQQSPLKSITQALKIATPNAVISLSAGTYSAETGESFPLLLNPGMTLQGDPQTKGRNIIIQGGGSFVSPTAAGQNVTMVAIHDATITGVTITNPNSRGYGLWIESANPVIEHNIFTRNNNTGISVNGSSSPTISQNYFHNNGGNGLVVYGTSRPEVRENIFDNTGYAVSVTQNAAPSLIANRLTNNRIAIVLEGNAKPILRNNVIENSREHGLVAIAQSRPDLGTRSNPGGNIFQGNRQLDIQNISPSETIVAFGNQINGRTLGNIDFFGNATPVVTSSPRPESSLSELPPLPPKPTSSSTSSALPPLLSRRNTTETSNDSPASSNRVAQTQGNTREISNDSPEPSNRVAQTQQNTRETSNDSPASSNTVERTQRNPRETASNRFNPRTSRPRSPSQSRPINLNVPPPQRNTPLRPLQTQPSRVAPNRADLSDLLVLQPNLKPDLNAIQTPEEDLLALPEPQPQSQPESLPPNGNYRVVVATQNIRQESQVRSLFPSAFRIVQNGQILMQIGVFREEKNVDKIVRNLEDNGLNARVIPVRL